VVEIAAVLKTNANPVETEDCAAISLAMANGALATSSITLGAATDTTRMRLVYQHLTAESGTAPYAPGTDDWHFVARDQTRQAEIDAILLDVPDAPAGFAGYFDAIADAIEGRPGREVTLAAGLASIELVSAIYHSDRSGERVSLPVDRSLPIATSLRP
jgi:predicted dehydrogenase